MKERPILFSGLMVRALLDGTKTQTRRVIKPQPPHWNWTRVKEYAEPYGLTFKLPGQDYWIEPPPYGVAGDRLWVREKHSTIVTFAGDSKVEKKYTVFAEETGGGQKWSDGQFFPGHPGGYSPGAFSHIKWAPSIFMPRWACRLVLEITQVRVQRLRDITEADAKAEGVTEEKFSQGIAQASIGGTDWNIPPSLKGGYCCLWDSLNAKRGFGWSKNPWVWVIDFKRAA